MKYSNSYYKKGHSYRKHNLVETVIYLNIRMHDRFNYELIDENELWSMTMDVLENLIVEMKAQLGLNRFRV